MQDHVGVARSQFSQEGLDLEPVVHDGHADETATVELLSNAELFLQYLRGADAEIYTEDVHGNDRTEILQVKDSLGAQIGKAAITDMGVERGGTVSGFTHGVAEIPDLALLLLRQPSDAAAALEQLTTDYVQADVCSSDVPNANESYDGLPSDQAACEYLAERDEDDGPTSKGEFWAQLAKGAAHATHIDQDRDNPYELDGEFDGAREKYGYCLGEYDPAEVTQSGAAYGDAAPDYCAYAVGWFKGYGLFAIAETVAGSKGALKGASSVDDAADAVESAGRQIDEVAYHSAARNGEAPTPRVTQQVFAEGGPDLDAFPDTLGSSGKAVRARNAWDDVDPAIKDALEPDQQRELLGHLGGHPAGAKLVNELGPQGTKELFRLSYDQIDDAAIRRTFFERYDRVVTGQQDRATFARLASDPSVRRSWVRSAGDPSIKDANVETTVHRVQDLESDGHGVLEFHRSMKLNKDFDGMPPHAEKEIVTDFEINGEKILYRVRNEKAPVGGEWTVERTVLERASDKEEILDDLALLPEEWDTTYNAVSRLDTSKVDMDTRLRLSTAGELDHRPGGVEQYHIPDGRDIEHGWSSEGDLNRFMEEE